MKRKKSIFMKSLCLMIGIIMMIGLCSPMAATAITSQDARIAVVVDNSLITATLYNPTSATINANIILASYRPDGVMRTCQAIPITTGAKTTNSCTFNDFNVDAYPDDLIKVFAWDQATSIPLSVDFKSRLYITYDGSGAMYDGKKVTANASVTEFSYVQVDQFTKRGRAYTAKKIGNVWTHAKAKDVELTLAFSPLQYTGAALPALQVSDVRLFGGGTKTRVLINVQ